MSKKNFKSIHIFIFPFRWHDHNGNHLSNIEDKTALNDIQQKINPHFWGKFRFSFKIFDNFQTFNEYTYFYPQVRDILSIKDPEEKRILNVLQYQYLIDRKKKPHYIISLKSGKEYILDIEDITLNFYPHGVGMLVFHLKNNSYSNKIDILKINDYGRRIFPQFLGTETSFISAPKDSFLADKISLENISTEFDSIVEEDFSYYDNLDNLNRQSFRLPEFIGKLLGKAFYNDNSQVSEIILTPVLDDRMFVISFFIDSEWMNELKEWDEEKKTYAYKFNKLWYQ